MKYSTVLLLLFGTISQADAIHLEQKQAPAPLPVKAALAPPKALAQVAVQAEHVKPVQKINLNNKASPTAMVQVKSDNAQGRHFSIQNKVKNTAKAEQLEKMEQALKQATEEAHKQLQAISTTPTTKVSSRLMELQQKQQKESNALKQQLANEEKKRVKEAKDGELYAMKIDQDEFEHRNQELVVEQRAQQMNLLQSEEAIQKIEAEREEQEFLEAQAKQDIKAAQAKRASQKANIARIKRKHELSRRQAEQKLKMFKYEKQMEAEAFVEQQSSEQELAKIANSEKAEKSQAQEIAKAKKETVEAQEAEAKAKKEIEVAKEMKQKAVEKSASSKEIEEKTKNEIKAMADEKLNGGKQADKAEKESKVSVTEKFAKEKDTEKSVKIKDSKKQEEAKPVVTKATETKKDGNASAAVEEITKPKTVTAEIKDDMSKMINDHQKMTKKIDAAHQGKKEKVEKELNQEIENFSVSLSDKHYTKAVQLRQQLIEMGAEEPKFRVHTKDAFRKMFTFPQIANNDYALDLFEQLENTENNLAQSPENEVMKENFVKTSVYVATQLKDRYGDQWINPRDSKDDQNL